MVIALGGALLLLALAGLAWALPVAADVFERRLHDARWGDGGKDWPPIGRRLPPPPEDRRPAQ